MQNCVDCGSGFSTRFALMPLGRVAEISTAIDVTYNLQLLTVTQQRKYLSIFRNGVCIIRNDLVHTDTAVFFFIL